MKVFVIFTVFYMSLQATAQVIVRPYVTKRGKLVQAYIRQSPSPLHIYAKPNRFK